MEKDGYREALAVLRELYPRRAALSVDEVAACVGCSAGTVRNAIKKKNAPLPSGKLGGRIVIPITAVARWMC